MPNAPRNQEEAKLPALATALAAFLKRIFLKTPFIAAFRAGLGNIYR